MDVHKKAPLTPKGREAAVRSVIEDGLSHAAVVVGLGILRIEPKRLDEILYGPVEVALVAIGEVDMKSPPGPVRASQTDRRSDRYRP